MIIFIITVIALGLFVLGLSITLMRKGHNIQGDVGENDAMRERGLECTASVIRREQLELEGRSDQEIAKIMGEQCTGCCSSCGGSGECATDGEDGGMSK